jgi:CDP-diacylglycerol--glycerol-3-phosphate 3-phosphatidyltransferase
VVDKVIVCGTFIFLVSVDWAQAFIPVWMAVLIVGREFLVNGLRGYLEAQGVNFAARWDGKLKMILQCCAIPAVFLARALDLSVGSPDVRQVFDVLALVLVWATFLLTVSSGARYVQAAAKALKEAPTV